MGLLLTILLILLQIIKFILLFILVVTLIFLFVPFCYEVRAAKEEAVNARVIFTWLFGLIYVEYEKRGEKSRIRLKLFGLKLMGYGKRRSGRAKETPPDEAVGAEEEKRLPPEEAELPKSAEPLAEEKPPDKPAATKEEESKQAKPEKNTADTQEESTKGATTEKKSIFANIAFAKQKFDEIYNHPDKKRIIELTKNLLRRLFAAIKPRKFSLDATVGLGEPHLVGYVLAGAGVIRGVTGLELAVTGVFDRKVLRFGGYVDGRIYVYRFVFPIVRFILARPVFKIIKQFLFKKKRGAMQNE